MFLMQCTKLSCFSPTGSGGNHCRQSTKTYLKILAKGKQKWMLVNCTSHYNQSYSMLSVGQTQKKWITNGNFLPIWKLSHTTWKLSL